MEYLEKCRKEIDLIDKELVKLFEKRINVVLEIAEYKKNNEMEIFQQDREKQVIKNALDNLENQNYSQEVSKFLNFIMDISKDIQNNKLQNDNARKNKIVLIGMPGSGKTTLGKIISKKIKYNFLDMDDYIEKTSKKSIKNIFEVEGEEIFRSLETEACREIVQGKKLIISSGGGVIKKSINIEILRKDCIVVFIDRSIENILNRLNKEEIDNRPLLKGKKETISLLYKERYDLYKNACDIQIKNDGSVMDAVDKIIEAINDKIEG